MKRFDTKTFIEKARKEHGELYGYDEVNYIDAHTKVKIVCPTHNVFEHFQYFVFVYICRNNALYRRE